MLLQALSATQWRDWVEYAAVYPIGERRDDYRLAYATAQLAACWAEDMKVEAFSYDWLKERPQPLSLNERIKLRAVANNAAIEAKRGG